MNVDEVSMVMYDKRVSTQIVVSLKGDEEAEMGIVQTFMKT
ncbi:MAG: hypothetical protein CM15mP44_9300 [Candidatus Neomarinimicrobiota bacterium]|nr:MAG: hypothetical protein CM15mP44_9300 [Candidatus Neomarinimicrobiota bacterium]